MVFDLWGTLVDELTHPEAHRLVYRQKTDETAELLGVDRDEFAKAWSATATDRMVGLIRSTEATLRLICANRTPATMARASQPAAGLRGVSDGSQRLPAATPTAIASKNRLPQDSSKAGAPPLGML